ncbi:Na+/H+ antiporter [Actinomadura kijaniata]|uniref:Na+/H+ antiporter n=1 Tax=Actinomadura kijaniata TaxID=46161 RepID=UPI000829D297|nr:Na+/H+ antiporter [Actinomadura kijaniata]
MEPERLFVVLLVVAVVVLLARTLAARGGVPDAIWLVVLGMAAGFVPALPAVEISPDLVLLGFLPPLIYHAAFFTSPREARADAVPIFAMAFGLTAVTTLAVAGTAYALLPSVGWAAAIAFGAAVAPTDAVAATSVLKRLGAPRRMVTILEGESLINDGVALTVFGLAVEAMTGGFSPGHGVLRAVQVVVGGVVYGLLVAVVARRVRRRVSDPMSQVIVSLIIPYAAYVPAENLGASGVLATVVTGFYLGTRGEGVLQPASRVAGRLFWRILIFLLESALFVLLGLEIREVLRDLGAYTWGTVLLTALAVTGVAVGVRLLWQWGHGPLLVLLPGGRHLRGLGFRERTVMGLAGMRGAITLAIALSLPRDAGPGRDVLVLLAALVVLATLVGQAPPLPLLLRRLGLLEAGDRRRVAAMSAREDMVRAALERLDAMADAAEVDERTAEAFRQMMELRLERLRYFKDEENAEGEPPGGRRVRAALAEAERAKLKELYGKGRIDGDTYQAIGRELDLAGPVSLVRPLT